MENKKSIILIVDDNQENVKVLAESIKIPDVEIAVALNGADALEYIEQELPDLILLDIMMPEMDGFEVCEILKSQVRTKEVPVIFLSALNSPESIIKGLEMGGADYLLKPFNIAEINARLKTHLKIRKAHEYAINLLRDFAGSIPDINLIVDESGVIVEVFSLHEAIADEVGDETFVGRKIEELLPNRGNVNFNERLQLVLSQRKHIVFEAKMKVCGSNYIFQCIIAPMGNTMGEKGMASFHALDITQSRYNEEQVNMFQEYNRKNLFFNNLLSGDYDCDEQNQLLRSYKINAAKKYLCCAIAHEGGGKKEDRVEIIGWLLKNQMEWSWSGRTGIMVLAETEEEGEGIARAMSLKEKLQTAFPAVQFSFGIAELPGNKLNLSLLCAWADVALLNSMQSEGGVFAANTENKIAE